MSTTISIQQELSSISQHVANLQNNTPFLMPNGYMESFHGRLMDRLMDESSHSESAEISPLLRSLQDQNPYAIPEGYFNTLKVAISKPQAPVVKVFTMGIFARYAAAACLIGILATVFLIGSKKDGISTAVAKTDIEIPAAQVSPDAISSYLEEMDNLSFDEDAENEVFSSKSNLLVDINSSTIKEILQEIPDNEISLYMAQNDFGDVRSLN